MPTKPLLLAFASLCVLASCKKEIPEGISKNPVQETDNAKAAPFTATKYNNKALLLTDNFILYNNDLSIGGGTDNHYGAIVEIDSISKQRINLNKNGDRCDEYNFIHILKPGFKGWISGKYVFEYRHGERDTTFTAQGVEFKIYCAKNFGLGASDEDGLTSCEERTPVILYNSKTKIEAFVGMEPHEDYAKGNACLLLDAHDGWYDKITGANLIDDILTLTIHREYQEGSADFTIDIQIREKSYYGKVVKVVKIES